MGQVLLGDCLKILPTLPAQSVDLVFGSPPYEDCRTYGIGFKLKGQAWADWMVQVYRESLRVCRGLVAFVVQGRTHNYQWTCTPALLIADLHRAGICVRNPPIYHRSGIPGSGGPDWLRSAYEWIICATNGGKLPWSDNTATGDAPKYGPGGDPTNRKRNGKRVWVSGMLSGAKDDMPHASHGGRSGELNTDGTITRKDGSIYSPPEKANPGNMIHCSGGHLGSDLAHENEAPFPEALAEFFIRSFCPPGGTVLDPFAGSGTVAAVAEKTGRKWITIDVRPSQIALINRRICEVRGIPPIPIVKKGESE